MVITPQIQRFSATYVMLDEFGLAPESGGVNSQPCTWVDAVRTVKKFIAEINESKRKK